MPDHTLDRRDTLAACLLAALGRREHAGRAPARLLDRSLWKQYAGNLQLPHLLALVAEDAAVRFPLPADPQRVLQAPADFSRISDPTVFSWLSDLPRWLDLDRAEALARYAERLGLPHRLPTGDLKRIQAGQRVLELPGTGGLLASRALERSPDANLTTNVTVLTSTWADRAMAGLVAMEHDAPSVDFVHDDPELAWALEKPRHRTFDVVLGRHPDRGGPFSLDRLSGFQSATVVLV